MHQSKLTPTFICIVLAVFVIYGCNKSNLTPALNKSTTATTKATTTDTVATTPAKATYATTPLTGDEITLVPYFYKSQTADSSYLYFIAQTRNLYCGTSSIAYTANLDASGNYALGFIDVSQPSPCGIGESKLGQVINFNHLQPNTLPNGNFPIAVTLNGNTYTGSITATTTTITFTWNYSSGVLIAPNQISR